jgi:hypothetical protein
MVRAPNPLPRLDLQLRHPTIFEATDRPRPSNQSRAKPHLDEPLTTATMPEVVDPRMISVTPRIRYNTIGGVNGPLVILDNVCGSGA